MSYQKCTNIIKQVRDLESKMKETDRVSAQEAKQLHNALVSLELEFISNQKQILDDFYDRSEITLISPEQLRTIQWTQLKITQLRTTLMKIIHTNPSINSTSDQIEPPATSLMESCSQKQKFLINLIESLETNSDVCATESQIRYDHLSFLYNSFISDQIETTKNSNDNVFDSQLKLSKHIQQKVIVLQTKLKKIIESAPSNSNSKSYTVESLKQLNLNEPSNQLKQSDPSTNLGPKKQEDIAEKMKKLNLIEPKPGPSNHFVQPVTPEQLNFSQMSTENAASKITETADHFEPGKIRYAPSKQPTVDHQGIPHLGLFSTRLNVDQQRQSDQSKQSDTCEHSCPWPYYKQQKELLAKINEFKSMDFLSCTKSQLRMYEEQVSDLCKSFISNFNEIKKRVDGYFLPCLIQIVQYNFAELKNIRSKIETRSKQKSAVETASSKPGTTFISSSQPNIDDRSIQTSHLDISEPELEKLSEIYNDMGKFKLEDFVDHPCSEDILNEKYCKQVNVLKKSSIDDQNEIFRRIRDGYFYQFQKTLSNDVEDEFNELLEDINRISRAIIF